MLLNLKAEMARKQIKVGDLAKFLSVSRKTIVNKINESTAFTTPEAFKILNELFPENDFVELFQPIEVNGRA